MWPTCFCARVRAAQRDCDPFGAGREPGQRVQLLLLESVMMALIGGALGLVFTAHYGIELLLKFFADKLPRMGEIGLSGSVLAVHAGAFDRHRDSFPDCCPHWHDHGAM